MSIIDRGKTIISRNPEITAYEIAVANGFVGTEAQWLESLITTPTYLVYTALLSQTGVADPTVIVLENTLGFDIDWTTGLAGQYTGVPSDSSEFDPLKTTLYIDQNNGEGKVVKTIYLHFTNLQVNISTSIISADILNGDIITTGAHELLDKTHVEIRVYP